MPIFKKVRCNTCKNSFYKYKGHINENLKLGHNFYCSRICLSEHHNKQVALKCENSNCRKVFKKQRKEISIHNYCSSSCAAIVNNQRYPKWPKRYCTECGEEFKNRDSKYCSTKCGYAQNSKNRFTYTREQIINMIKEYTYKNSRVPAKREVIEISNKAAHLFGSWNKAILASGLTPNRSHDNRMYKRVEAKARDGHLCDSVSEALIDNWLAKNKIPHERNVSYSKSFHKADWGVKNNKIFIEYFGLAKDSPRYDRSIRKKKRLCKELKIKLIEIYPRDLYPKTFLDNKLKNLFSNGRI